MARTVKVELTIPQARALWAAARYGLDFPEDTGQRADADRPLRNAFDRLDAAIDRAEAARPRPRKEKADGQPVRAHG